MLTLRIFVISSSLHSCQSIDVVFTVVVPLGLSSHQLVSCRVTGGVFLSCCSSPAHLFSLIIIVLHLTEAHVLFGSMDIIYNNIVQLLVQ